MWLRNQKNSCNEKALCGTYAMPFVLAAIVYYLKILKIYVEYKIYLLISF